jgi:hypothetical protein
MSGILTSQQRMEMRKLCFALLVALGASFVSPMDQAAANGFGKSRREHPSTSLAGVTPVLAAKTREIVASCGSVVISTIAPRPNQSNHPIGRAVDLRGNPECIYAHLKDWPGGYSTDYAAVKHVHISYNPRGQEWGLRFVHGKQNGNGTSYASAYRRNVRSVLVLHNAGAY